jgi:hypothetical protein
LGRTVLGTCGRENEDSKRAVKQGGRPWPLIPPSKGVLVAYQRKTEDEYQIHQKTEEGWEEVCAESTWKEARQTLKEYRENQPEYPVKSVKKRVPVIPSEPSSQS